MGETAIQELVYIEIDQVTLEGALEIPPGAHGIVLFAHGSGSSRHSPRNNYVARILRRARLGTLLIDLLTEQEDAVYETRFDIDLLTQRLIAATKWLGKQPESKDLRVGYFGASTGAAAALKAAAKLGGHDVGAVVSRGGRPDLAEPNLENVDSPTLLIVGGEDHGVIELNEFAYQKLHSLKQLALVPGATHLFEEPGTLEEAARLATQWFNIHLHS